MSPGSPPHSSLSTPHRFLITGGCGFIGTNLIARILKDIPGARIRVLDNLSVGTRDDLSRVCTFREIDLSDPMASTPSAEGGQGPAVQLIIGDIRSPDTCLAAARDMDIMVHLAANTGVAPSIEDPVGDMVANVSGTLNMLEAARHQNVPRFVLASSGAAVGECEPPIHEELASHPVSPYGASKLSGEAYCSSYFRAFGVLTASLRFGNVYGPGSSHKASVVAKFIRQALQGETCEIYGDGEQTRDFIYIDDLVTAILKAAASKGGEVYQISAGEEHTVNEIAEIIARVLKTDHNITMNIRHGAIRQGDVRRNYADTSKAERDLGWRPETPLLQGIKNSIDWFVERI